MKAGGGIHCGHADDVLSHLEVDAARGLTDAEVAERLARDGANELPPPPRPSAFKQLVAQFANPIVLTLLGAAVIALVNASARGGEPWLVRYGDALAILIIVILNAVIGFLQERRAEAALDALQKMQTPHARTRRSTAAGAAPETRMVSARDLVVGDVLELEAGDAVPADARLVRSVDLATLEAALTGESAPVGKDACDELPPDTPLGDRTNVLFLGTQVVRGTALAVVAATGARTEIGKLSALINAPRDRTTPLEEKLESFGHRILWACLGLSALLFGYGMLRHERAWSELLLEAVSLAVAAIPEGLPAITTITLALGMQRMAKQGAIVRKLAAVETLGAATVICTDKTGTLTQNEMTVERIFAGGVRIVVSGVGYGPKGELRPEGTNGAADGAPITTPRGPLEQLLASAALCTNATLDVSNQGVWSAIGDPTEAALLALASKAGMPKDSLVPSHPVVKELPFDSDRKRMTIVTLDAHGREVAHTKGSADVLLPLCSHQATDAGSTALDPEARAAIQHEADRMSREALRVLAIARREIARGGEEKEDVETRLTFLGLVGMIDPPRPGVEAAMKECADAGVRVVMITGDHKLTAMAIATKLGIWTNDPKVDPDTLALSGAQIEELDDEALAKASETVRVFARVTAEEKLRIVRAMKSRGEIVAMTGDGVNDAPALREAHIGIAMGKGGTDVARQAADMVLADDNFASIVLAVHQGRAIYRNIQKSIFFLLSSNMGLLLVVMATSFFHGLPPLRPLMILWINLVTNGLPALALGVDPPDSSQMKEPPRPRGEGLLGTREYLGILAVGVAMAGAALACYLWPWNAFDPFEKQRARSVAFSLLALSPLVHAFNCRSPRISAFASRPLISWPLVGAVLISAAVHLVAVLVPSLRVVFLTFLPTPYEWLVLLLLSVSILPFVEVLKVLQRLVGRRFPALGLSIAALLAPLSLIALVSLAGCGGNPATPAATTAPAATASPKIGDLAAQQGGLLGGGRDANPDVPGEDTWRAHKASPKLDGALADWPELTEVTFAEEGNSGATLAAGLAYDDVNLYIAGEVHDPTPLKADHTDVQLSVPSPHFSAELVIKFDAKTRQGSILRFTDKAPYPLAGAHVVGSPLSDGYTFEASVPWADLFVLKTERVGFRADVKYVDESANSPRAIVANHAKDTPPPALLIEPEAGLFDGLLTERKLTPAKPDQDQIADVAGDALKERILVYGQLLVVLGPHYRDGAQFDWLDLGADLVRLDIKDVTGDGKDDLLLLRRKTSDDGVTREAFEVLTLTGAAPTPIFSHEVRLARGGNEVADSVHAATKTIDVASEKVVGWDAASFDIEASAAIDPIVLPWSTPSSETYRFDGKKFVKVPAAAKP